VTIPHQPIYQPQQFTAPLEYAAGLFKAEKPNGKAKLHPSRVHPKQKPSLIGKAAPFTDEFQPLPKMSQSSIQSTA
jgi:hypothetical protein